MRYAITVSALVGVVAAGCNNDNCLRAVIASAFTTRHGAQDCSSYLAVTVTPATSTVTSTVTVVPTEYTTEVETDVFTTSQTTTVATETQTMTTLTTLTASTQTNLQTTTVTASQGPLKREALASSAFPAYASACSSFERYVSACSRIGVLPSTVVAETPLTTLVVTQISSVTASILSTTSTTQTAVVSITASTAETETQVISVTDTTSVTVTTTQPAAPPAASCTIPTGAFKAVATQYNNSPLDIYANLLNGLTGGLTWNAASGSTAAAVQNKYIWAVDAQGHLNLAYNVPPYTYKYSAYLSTASAGSNWPQVNTEASVASQVAAGAAISYINACVDSVTGELRLDAGGRKEILWCGSQVWLSFNNNGSDINRGTCVRMFPTIVPV